MRTPVWARGRRAPFWVPVAVTATGTLAPAPGYACRPVAYGTANTIMPTMVAGDGAHVEQHASLDFPISLHSGIVEDKLVFLEAGGTAQGSLALRQRPDLLELLFSGNPAGLSAVRSATSNWNGMHPLRELGSIMIAAESADGSPDGIVGWPR